MSSLLRRKPIDQAIAETEESEHQLRKELGPFQLTVFGIGVIVGTGIFVLTGEGAAERAGPAIALSFVVAAVACALAALCYAEFASTVPVAGSAYTFSYSSLGELVAWIIGWDLILELALGAATVAVGWSGYFQSLMGQIGIDLPKSIAGETASVNIPAAAIVLILTGILIAGVKLSSQFNAVVVIIKLAIILLVIFAGISYIKTGNWDPFIPKKKPGEAEAGIENTPLIQAILGQPQSTFGVGGIFTGAALIFFAFIGFDIVATAAEETRNPQRDLPIGIFGSLIICTILYVAVSLVVTGMLPYNKLGVDAPLSYAFEQRGNSWAPTIIDVGALAGLTTTMVVLMYGQSRVFFAMARDHLLPAGFAHVHPRFGTPYRISAVTGVAVAVVAAFVPLKTLADLVNIGTLFAFVLVSIGVMILRRTDPDRERAFRTPLVPLVPILAALASIYLMLNLVEGTWIRFGVWLLIGFVLYFTYSRSHSRLAPGGDLGGGRRGQDRVEQPGEAGV